MKPVQKLAGLISFLMFAAFVLNSCCKNPQEATVPDEIGFGKKIVFLNGNEVDYIPIFKIDTFNNHLTLRFRQDLTLQTGLINNLNFGLLPMPSGPINYPLIEKGTTVMGEVANASFGQIIDIDLKGYTYDLHDDDDSFFKIDAIDTIKMEVKGRFRAKFCRTSKNGNKDLALPKVLLFQGVFHDSYTPF